MGTVRYTVVNGQVMAENRNGVRKTYVPDPSGSTIALLDDKQKITDTFSYSPFGELKSRTGTTPTPFQYIGTRGYYTDPNNRVYVRARTYQPNYARWMTVDPLWPGESAYGYARGNPVSLSDMFGLRPMCAMQAQRPCSDILRGIPSKEIPKDLLDCLAKAGSDKEAIQKCIEKFKGKLKDKARDAIADYLGCLAGSQVGPQELHPGAPLNPCNPPRDDLCQECCYSKFIACLIKCMQKSRATWNLCIAGCNKGRGGFDDCLTKCPD